MASSHEQSRRRHIATVHLEDFFQVGPLRHAIPQRYWPRFETRAEQNTQHVLDMLDKAGCKATFFTLGWIADRMPDLVAEVVRRGHEVASKGYFHRSIGEMSPEEFRSDVRRSRAAIERASGQSVQGYRIARGWFSARDLWALDILAQEGFLYDSSLRPLGLDLLGAPERRKMHEHRSVYGRILEIPLPSWQFCGLSLPIAGGNYMRQLPHAFLAHRVAEWSARADAPFVFYFHVWEVDPTLPRINGPSFLNRIRQYRNLDKMSERIAYYLERYAFTSIAEYLESPPRPVTRGAPQLGVRVPKLAAPGSRQPVTIVVPCFNEEAVLSYLANTLDALQEQYTDQYKFHFVFVDDGSADGTWQRLNAIFGSREGVTLVRHESNRGVAAASMTGIRLAPTEAVCVIDCDCTYDPEQLTRMLPLLTEDVDLVTASPYHREGKVVNVPGWRLFLSRSLSRLYQLVLRHKLNTYTACFRVYRRSAVERLRIENDGYLGIAEILARLDMSGSKICEFPAVLEARLMGQSKMKILKVIVGHLKLLMSLIVHKHRYAHALDASCRPITPAGNLS